VISRAQEPFRFFSRLTLTRMTGIKAKNLRELLEHLKTVPESVIYQHTHRFLQEHQYLVPEPPNDFGYWVTHMLLDEELGERLTAFDIMRYHSLNDLRLAIVSVIENHLANRNNLHQVPEGKEFHFMSAVRFSMPTRYQAYNLSEFLRCLQKVSISSLYLHIFEAKMRTPLGINDFANWFEAQLGEKALAKQVADMDPYTQTLEGLRAKIILLVQNRLEELPRVTT
jgi:hypothetical protein